MRYVIGIIAGVFWITGSGCGRGKYALCIAYCLNVMVSGVILIYECYIIRQKKR